MTNGQGNATAKARRARRGREGRRREGQSSLFFFFAHLRALCAFAVVFPCEPGHWSFVGHWDLGLGAWQLRPGVHPPLHAATLAACARWKAMAKRTIRNSVQRKNSIVPTFAA